MKHQINTVRAALAVLEAIGENDMYAEEWQKTKQALTALAELEAMVGKQEPVGEVVQAFADLTAISWADNGGKFPPVGTKLYAAPVAQQYEAGDMASASAQGFRDGVASVVRGEPVAIVVDPYNAPGLQWLCKHPPGRGDRLFTAAPLAQQPQARPDFTDEWTGYLKDGETPFERFLRERKDVQSVLKLYQRALEENERLKAKQPQAEKRCQYCDGTGDVHGIDGQWRGECHCQKQPQAEAVQATTIAEAARDVGKWLNERPNRPIDLRHVAMLVAHTQQPQAEAVPTLYVSRGQLENLKPDPEGTAGTYLPVRKTPRGKFTHPLFAAPQQAEAVPNQQTIEARWNYVNQRACDMSASKYERLCEVLHVEVDEDTFDLGQAIDAAIAQQKGGGA